MVNENNSPFDTCDLGEAFGYECAHPSLIETPVMTVVGGPQAANLTRAANYKPPIKTADGWDYGIGA